MKKIFSALRQQSCLEVGALLSHCAEDMITKMNLDADGDNRISKDDSCLATVSFAYTCSLRDEEHPASCDSILACVETRSKHAYAVHLLRQPLFLCSSAVASEQWPLTPR